MADENKGTISLSGRILEVVDVTNLDGNNNIQTGTKIGVYVSRTKIPGESSPITHSLIDSIKSRIDILESKCPYPVGSIYIQQKDTPTPADLYNDTCWICTFQGKTLVGLDELQAEFDLLGGNGGDKKINLTLGQLPRHSHTIVPTLDGNPDYPYDTVQVVRAGYHGDMLAMTEPAGNNESHYNLQPYEVVNYWRRTICEY